MVVEPELCALIGPSGGERSAAPIAERADDDAYGRYSRLAFVNAALRTRALP